MIDLFDNETGALIGSITEADLKVLSDALEEESETDQDYYIDAATIDLIGDGRATDHLIHLLKTALGARDGVEVRWARR
jgi:processive 1,2-diacylglycerol beta-glucosyltransferase